VVLSLLPISLFAEIVNINKADAATFQHYLKGIGEKKAKSIIQYRTEHKVFKRVDEIMEVRGIGEKIFNKIKENLSLTKGAISLSKKETVKETKLKDDVSIESISTNDVNKLEVTKTETLEKSTEEESTTK
jgi:competence protein ComEA